MKIFLSFYTLVLSLCYCLQTESRACTDTTSKCSGDGSFFNETSQSCVCGLDSQHIWGDKCQFGRVRLTNQSGFINEGDQKYHGSSKYMFIIDSNTNYLPIRLAINQFSTECNWDYLYIYDGKSVYSPLHATLSGKISPQSSNHTRMLTTISGAAFLYFYTDQCTSEDGFNISYYISTCRHNVCNNHGICDEAGLCQCDHGWAGKNCTVYHCCGKTYLINSEKVECEPCGYKESESIIKRASHAVTSTNSHSMWVYGGITSTNNHDPLYREKLNRPQLYDMKEEKWHAIDKYSSYSSDEMRYGHSLVGYGDSLYVFGGTVYKDKSYKHPKITNDLLEFNSKTNSWQRHDSSNSLPVTGHAAVRIINDMYIFFGYNEDYTFVNKVQKFDLLNQVKKSWSEVETKGAIVNGRSGHSATYDHVTNTVYIIGGYILRSRNGFNVGQDLLMFKVADEKWVVGRMAPIPRVLHSAGIIDNNLIVFGGNANIRSHGGKQCFNNDLLVYSLDCNVWLFKKVDVMNNEMRYGHSSMVLENSSYIFGGFNGEFLNDILKIVIGDDCSKFTSEKDCLNFISLSGCIWHKASKTCIKPALNVPESSIIKPDCPKSKSDCGLLTCIGCKSRDDCSWKNDKCEAKTSMLPEDKDRSTCIDYQASICSTRDSCYSCHLHQNCSWNSNFGLSSCSYVGIRKPGVKCFGDSNNTKSCHRFGECSTCLQSSECLWCESTLTCLPRSVYIANFPYGQCNAYVQDQYTCPATRCDDQKSCRNCLQLPECGWCEGIGKEMGRCMNGSNNGPNLNGNCPKPFKWMFTKCPACHCNGQSKCHNGTDECISCNENVIGKHCDQCAVGFYGDPSNNGSCSKKCNCNGHLHSCDMKGQCTCNAQGVTGNNCERCELGYLGDPRNGGICYYPLQANYQYQTRMTRQIMAGYILEPTKSKQSFNVEVSKETGPTGYLNLTIFYANNHSTVLTSAYPLGKYETKITEESYTSSEKAYIKAVVYGWEKTDGVFYLKISFGTSTQLFDLVYFLIMFIVCFVALLVILSALWKMKQRYDRYIYNRRQKQEQEERVNRPFTNVTINLNERKMLSYEERKKKIPTLISLQSLRQADHCGPASFLIQLPRDHYTDFTPGGQCGLCIGTVLIVQPQKRTKTQIQHSYRRKRTKAKAIPV